MTEQGDPAAARPSGPTAAGADQWAAAFQQAHGREPTMSEYQQALARGEIAKERDPSVQQMTDGARQIATGVKNFYDARVAPAAKSAAGTAAAGTAAAWSATDQGAASNALAPWVRRGPFILAGTAFVGILALFLPIGSVVGMSVNFFSEGVRGEGIALLFLMLLIIAASAAVLVTRMKWARIAAGVLGLIGGLFGIFDGFGNMISLSGARGVSIGFGLVLLALVGVVLLAASGLVLLGLRRAGPGPSA